MVKRLLFCGLCVQVGLAATAAAAPPVRTMYTEVLTREQAVRNALAADDATAALLDDVRAVVGSYEAVIRQYPLSGYSDNALWQAGRLALDAFTQFGQPKDRDTGVRLLRRLVTSYPASRLVPQVSAELARVESPTPDAAAKIATIQQIRRTILPDAVRITIELDGEVQFRDQRIADPSRVFVDLPGTRAAAGLVDRTLRFENDADLVRQVRIGRHPKNTTRVVLDVAGVTSYSVYPLYNPHRLVIDCVRPTGAAAVATTAPPPAAAVAAPIPVVAAPTPVVARPATVAAGPREAPPLAARRMTRWLRRPPSGSPRHTMLIASARADIDASVVSIVDPPIVVVEPVEPGAPTTPVPRQQTVDGAAAPLGSQGAEGTPPVLGRRSTEGAAPPAKNLTGGFSIARQLGLGISRIVIDPGHGGHDPGATGKGVSEAEVVLDVALRLEKLLQKTPGVEVILTRRTDDFIPLPERTAIANREGADLFLSIHANASPNAQARGVETYFLNFANNLTAAAVAARENAASGQLMGALPDFVKAIALNNKLDESRDLATHVQRAMVARLKTANMSVRDLGIKQAPFVVLIGAAMPSVLAEISFVTNVQEAKLLKGNVYRQRIAESLFTAIRNYQGSLKDAKAVALQ